MQKSHSFLYGTIYCENPIPFLLWEILMKNESHGKKISTYSVESIANQYLVRYLKFLKKFIVRLGSPFPCGEPISPMLKL